MSRLTTSAAVLIAANSFPLYGVAVLDWEVFPLVLLFWLENVIIGCFNVFKMLLIGPYDAVRWIGKMFMAAFFVVHYGGFAAIHGMFVVLLFGIWPAPLVEVMQTTLENLVAHVTVSKL